MKSVIVCTSSKDVFQRLSTLLAAEDIVVEAAYSHSDVLSYVEEARRLAVIVEARRDHFADLLRNLCRLQSDILVHLVQDGRVFCHYPFSRQPVSLLFAIDNAGLSFPAMASPAGASAVPIADGGSIVLNA